MHRLGPRLLPRGRLLLAAVATLVAFLAVASTLLPPVGNAGRIGPDPPGEPAGSQVATAARSLSDGMGPAAGRAATCAPGPAGAATRCSMSSTRLAPSPAAGGSAAWVPYHLSPPGFGWLAYDPLDHYAVFLAYDSGSGPAPTSTWLFRGGSWSEVAAGPEPGFCPRGSMTYDSIDGYVLYTPGAGNCTGASGPGFVWTFSAGAWTERSSNVPALDYAALASDPKDGYMVLFGGTNGSCAKWKCNYTWTYRGGNWTVLAISSPASRWGASAAWDPASHAIVMFGGDLTSYPNGTTNQTWTFSGGTWSQPPIPVEPPARTFAAMAVDPAGGLAMYGGQLGPATLNDSWTFSAGFWRAGPVSPAPPHGRWSSAYLNTSGGPMLLVGVPSTTYTSGAQPGVPADAWQFNGSVWTNATPSRPPSVNWDFALTYDAADGYVLLFGTVAHFAFSTSSYTTLTWSFRAGVWSNLTSATSPSPRQGEGLAYDAADGYVVLFGGSSTGLCGSTTNLSPCADTWEFVAGHWGRLTPRSSPSNRTGMGLVYDGGDGYLLLYGGACPGAGSAARFCDDTWKFHGGNWTNLSSGAGTPPGGIDPQPVYDSTAGYVLLYDEYMDAAGATASITWKFQGGRWSNLTAGLATQPPHGFAVSVVDDPSHGGVLWFGSENGGVGAGLAGVFDASWEFAQGLWHNLSAAPFPRVVAQAVADDGNAGPLLVGGTFGASPPAAPYPAGVNPVFTWVNVTGGPPVITSFAASPPSVDVGDRTVLGVAVAGGTPPFAYTYTGLPTGCTSANTSSLSCTPTLPSVGNVTVSVQDGSGNHTSAVTLLLVNPLPTITGFRVTPTAVVIGSRAVFTVNSSGGTGPWGYAFTGLPSGCVSQSVPILPCIPTAAGNFTVRAVVQDALNATATASVRLVVTAAGSAGHPRISSFAAVPPAIVLGNSTNFSVVATGSGGPLTYAYSGLPSGCSSNNSSALYCTPTSAGTSSVTVVVVDTNHRSTSVATNVTVFPVGGGAGLTVSAFSAAPAKFVIGASTTLQVVAAGGVGPIGYAYRGLPPGCASQNLSLLPCMPTANGTFAVAVRVSDSAGHAASVRLDLEVLPSSVGPGPSVTGFTASPNRVVVGSPLTLVVAVAGGLLPIRFAYTDLPTGCATNNTPVLLCTPTVTGTYAPKVVVSDALGRSTNRTTSVLVVPVPGPQPGQPNSGAVGWATLLPYLGVFVAATIGTAVVFGFASRRESEREKGQELVRELERDRGGPLDLDEGD
ncbi:MAG TPA: hypothetical protein VFF67_02655 [Thermoplasmata archaeon]|nr:hypothetical protein [Thermoplasmata archaeon]